MPRALKPWPIREHTHHKSGRKFLVMLDRNKTDWAAFIVDVDGRRFDAMSEDEVVAKVTAWLDANESLDWRRIIVVRTSTGFSNSQHTVMLRSTQHEVAERADGKWMERKVSPFHSDPVLSTYTDARTSQPVHGLHVLPFSDATWDALQEIEARLRALRERIEALVAAAAAADLLAALALSMPALPPAAAEEDDER